MPKINELTRATALTGTDLLPMDNSSGTATKAVSGDQIKTYVTADVEAEVTDLKNAVYEFPDMYVGNYVKSSDGGLTASNDGCISDYIPVPANIVGTTLYYCCKNTFGAGCSVAFYASDKSYISYAKNGDDTLATCTIPTGAAYYRLSCMTTSKSLVYIKYDVANSPKQAYAKIDTLQDEINAVYVFPDLTSGQYLKWIDGSVGTSSGYSCSDYIAISPDLVGEIMEYSGKISSSDCASIVFYASDKIAISPYYRVWNDNPVSCFIPSNAKYFRISCVTTSKSLVYAKYYANTSVKNIYREISGLTVEENSVWG